jgi:hypothetical protein
MLYIPAVPVAHVVNWVNWLSARVQIISTAFRTLVSSTVHSVSGKHRTVGWRHHQDRFDRTRTVRSPVGFWIAPAYRRNTTRQRGGWATRRLIETEHQSQELQQQKWRYAQVRIAPARCTIRAKSHQTTRRQSNMHKMSRSDCWHLACIQPLVTSSARDFFWTSLECRLSTKQ